MDDLQELLATGACARIGGGDDAHSSRTSRSSRLARAQEARITARLHGRRPAGSAREQHGSQLVGRGWLMGWPRGAESVNGQQLL